MSLDLRSLSHEHLVAAVSSALGGRIGIDALSSDDFSVDETTLTSTNAGIGR
ncbi:hypothetical protein EDF38_0503 [Frigoribacterium sp. PhB160]|jgi:hypothetical protein|nr:hypothetical protein EDF38_0503 [Frigoribacterium sp. PhB160]